MVFGVPWIYCHHCCGGGVVLEYQKCLVISKLLREWLALKTLVLYETWLAIFSFLPPGPAGPVYVFKTEFYTHMPRWPKYKIKGFSYINCNQFWRRPILWLDRLAKSKVRTETKLLVELIGYKIQRALISQGSVVAGTTWGAAGLRTETCKPVTWHMPELPTAHLGCLSCLLRYFDFELIVFVQNILLS